MIKFSRNVSEFLGRTLFNCLINFIIFFRCEKKHNCFYVLSLIESYRFVMNVHFLKSLDFSICNFFFESMNKYFQ